MSKSFSSEFVPTDLSDFRVRNREAGVMDFFLPSMTRQEFADECDINLLMERYEKQGVISHVNRANPVYIDMSDIPDLRESLDLLRDATLAFNGLPAKARYALDNDPVKFVEFANDPANLDKMREWGLAPPAKLPAEPISVKVIAEPLQGDPVPPVKK